MDHQASVGARREAFDAYRNEPIPYRGHPVRRGFALLLESDISGDDIEELTKVGDMQPLKVMLPLPDDEARIAIYADLIDIERDQASFEFPHYRRS